MKFISNKLLFALFSIGVFGSGALNGSEMKRPYGYSSEENRPYPFQIEGEKIRRVLEIRYNNVDEKIVDMVRMINNIRSQITNFTMTNETDLDHIYAVMFELQERYTQFNEYQSAINNVVSEIAVKLEELSTNNTATEKTREAAAMQAANMREQVAEREKQAQISNEHLQKEQQQSRLQALDRAEKEATQQLFAQVEDLTAELSRFRYTAEINMNQGLRNSNFYWEADTLFNTLHSVIVEVRNGREVSATLRDLFNDSTRSFEQLKQRFALAQRQQARKRWKRAGDQVRATTRFQAGGKRAENARLANLAREEEQRREQARLEAQRREEARRDARRTELSEQGEQKIAAREAMRQANMTNKINQFTRSSLAKARSSILIRNARLEELLKREAQRGEEAQRHLEALAKQQEESNSDELNAALARNRADAVREADRLRTEQNASKQFKVPVQSQSRDVSGAEGMWGGKGAHQTNTTGRAKELKTAANPEQQYLVNNIIAQLVKIEELPRNISKIINMNALGNNINVSKLTAEGWALLANAMQSQGVGTTLLQEAARSNKISSPALLTIVDRLKN